MTGVSIGMLMENGRINMEMIAQTIIVITSLFFTFIALNV